MMPPTTTRHSRPVTWPVGLEKSAARELLGAAAILIACAIAIEHAAGFGIEYAAKVALMLGACGLLVWRRLPLLHPHSRLGPANRVTLTRLGLVTLLAAVIGQHMADARAVAWAVVSIGTIAALLDLLDGRLARSSGLSSDFGARFDMETDAWYTLVLCGLVLWFGKAGPWVLAAGLMRYVYVLAAHAWPWLARPLAPSLRRKTVCVVQITLLIICLGPIIPVAWSNVLALVALVLLAWSFGLDVRTQYREARAS